MDAGAAVKLGSPDPRAGVLKTILWESRPTRLRNADVNPESLGLSAGHPAIHSWLGVPIASPTRVYGYIGLIDKVGLDQFSEEDERLAVILAAQVGRVYQNGSLTPTCWRTRRIWSGRWSRGNRQRERWPIGRDRHR